MQREMKILEFEEKRNDKRLVYWIEYAAKFGFTHLHTPAYKLSKIKQNDFDIAAILIGIGFAILYAFSWISRRILQAN